MIDHVSLPVRDLDAARAFFSAALAPLGYRLLVTRPHTIGFGKTYPEVWLNLRPQHVPVLNGGVHVALRAQSEAAVQAFHAAALAAGGTCDGAPGSRKAEMTPYFGAFVLCPDGNKLEAVAFPAKA
jgi:catechol 2,3-dioxygenase-like lactoylglutathione lyase family enzyme